MEKYSFEKAHDVANEMQEKIDNEEAKNYFEAERITEQEEYDNYLETCIDRIKEEGGQNELIAKLEKIKHPEKILLRFISKHELENIFEKGYVEKGKELIYLEDEVNIEDVMGSRLISKTDWDRNMLMLSLTNKLNRLLREHREDTRDIIINDKRSEFNQELIGTGWRTVVDLFNRGIYPETMDYLEDAVKTRNFDNFVEANKKLVIRDIENALNDIDKESSSVSEVINIEEELEKMPAVDILERRHYEKVKEAYKAKTGDSDSDAIRILGTVESWIRRGATEKWLAKNPNLEHALRLTENAFGKGGQLNMLSDDIRESLDRFGINKMSSDSVTTLKEFFTDKDFFKKSGNVQKFIDLLEVFIKDGQSGGISSSDTGQYEYLLLIDGQIKTDKHIRDDWKESTENIPIDNILAISSIIKSKKRAMDAIDGLTKDKDKVPFFNTKGKLIYPI